MQKRKLLITKDGFYLEGKPLRILSGAIHYFRVPRAYWEDRLVKLRAYGFNTVETYIPWNLHEPQEGVFEWEGEKDFAAFALLAGTMLMSAAYRYSYRGWGCTCSCARVPISARNGKWADCPGGC